LTLPSAAENLALDEALLDQAEQCGGPGVLWFSSPRDYAVVLGASRSLRDEVHEDACRADGVPILRRVSGGGTVVIGPGTLNISVILPQTAAPGLWAVDTAHRFVLDRITGSIGRAGAAIELRGTGDLTMGGRKCGGSAQRRLKRSFLVHCTILLDFAIDRIARYLKVPERQPAYRAGRSHLEFLTNLSLPRASLVAALCDEFRCAAPSRNPETALPMSLVHALVREKYSNPAWIERF
jgi:lipoate---protein ligase